MLVKLVKRALRNINKLNGLILSQKMKSAQISDILNIWEKKYKIQWMSSKSRPGDKVDEYLVGESEINNTKKIMIDDIEHYIIEFNKKIKNHLKKVYFK